MFFPSFKPTSRHWHCCRVIWLYTHQTWWSWCGWIKIIFHSWVTQFYLIALELDKKHHMHDIQGVAQKKKYWQWSNMSNTSFVWIILLICLVFNWTSCFNILHGSNLVYAYAEGCWVWSCNSFDIDKCNYVPVADFLLVSIISSIYKY